jgi:hypothetical protein
MPPKANSAAAVTATKKAAPKRMLGNIVKVVVVLPTTDKQPTKPHIVGIGDDVHPYAYILVLRFHMNMNGVLVPNDAYHHVKLFEDESLAERQRAINHRCFTKEHLESIMEGNYSSRHHSLQQPTHGTGGVTTFVLTTTETYTSFTTHSEIFMGTNGIPVAGFCLIDRRVASRG